MKAMSTKFIRGASFRGYGPSLAVGIGIPIPVLDEEMARFTGVCDADISAPVVDYGKAYGENNGEVLGRLTYDQLRSGRVKFMGKDIPTGAISSYAKAREIAEMLKGWIKEGRFLLSVPVQPLPQSDSGYAFHPLPERKPQ
jgi:uncharacterized protein (DUF39 family)